MSFPSTFLDIQDAVITKARLDATLDRSKVKDWINQSYSQVCVETEANVTSATMALTATVASYNLPDAVSRIKQMAIQPAGSTAFDPPLTRTTLDEVLNRRQSGGDTGTPTLYALVGLNQFEVWPTPTAADVITIYYVGYPTALSANGDTPILEEPYSSKLLEYGALVQAGDFKGDPSTEAWENQYASWMGRYANHLQKRGGLQPGQFHQWGDGWTDGDGY